MGVRLRNVSGTLYLGTSGFAYKEWKGPFYPEGLKDREMLGYYASRFRSVEVNYTFRRQASESTLANWKAQVPEGFQFTLKAHQRITHWLQLRDADESVSTFLDRARLLGDRLGPTLFQCPPTLQFDRALIENFVGFLPPTHRYAMEFRHPSWEEAKPILAAQNVAWCTAETDESSGGEPVFEPFGYLRLRKEAYTDEDIKRWAERIAPALADGHDVYTYFKHEDKGAGPIFAEKLAQLIG
jgi:uncharacterized protein YecE (DUF72 family)